MIFPPKWLLIQAAVSSFTQCTVICLPSHLGKGHAAMVFTYVCVYSQPEVARRCSCNGERKENSEKQHKEDEYDFLLTAYKSYPSWGGQEKVERSELIETRFFS